MEGPKTPPGLTPDQQAEWLKCAGGPAYFIRTYCQIELDDGEGGLLWGLFEPWPLQLEAIPLLDKAKKAILLKARQQGLTWIAICLALHRMIFRAVAAVLMFSKTDDDAKEMTRRLGGVWERLPAWLRPEGKANTEAVSFANGSRAISFSTKGGRSRTGTLAIVDEADFQPDLPKLMNAVKPTVDAGGCLWLISTADKDKPESMFKKIFRAALAGLNGYLPLFYSWRMRPTRTDEWYAREKAETIATTGSLDFVYQEYPETVEQAFAPKELNARLPLAWIEQCCRPAVAVDLGGSLHHLMVDAPAVPGAGAGLSIPGLVVYAVPQPGRQYRIGADPAEGLPAGDDSACDVLDDATGEQVATLAGKIVPALFGHYIANLSNWYNAASVLVERNNHCGRVVEWIMEHRPEVFVMNGRDDKPGWNTLTGSKAFLYDGLAEALRTEGVIIHDPGTKAQLASIQAEDLSAPPPLHDDRAMSFALAQMARDLAPRGKLQIWV